MKYNTIYNQLNDAKIIEKVLKMTNYDEIGIIEGISYLEYFLNSTTYNNMTYWCTSNNETVKLICREYAQLMLEKTEKRRIPLEYMLKTMI